MRGMFNPVLAQLGDDYGEAPGTVTLTLPTGLAPAGEANAAPMSPLTL
jgi:hypothetical protein